MFAGREMRKPLVRIATGVSLSAVGTGCKEGEEEEEEEERGANGGAGPEVPGEGDPGREKESLWPVGVTGGGGRFWRREGGGRV